MQGSDIGMHGADIPTMCRILHLQIRRLHRAAAVPVAARNDIDGGIQGVTGTHASGAAPADWAPMYRPGGSPDKVCTTVHMA